MVKDKTRQDKYRVEYNVNGTYLKKPCENYLSPWFFTYACNEIGVFEICVTIMEFGATI